MMLTIEEILGEVLGADTNEQGLPPGFRFHPTDEELVTFYLASKVFYYSRIFCGVEIAEVDLNRCEPWELPEMAKMGEREWYFFSKRDRKYPTGLRTNRATEAGYWKATGKDREVYSTSASSVLIGMKKTLVFYKGRAPRGEKTNWVMHEYRLHGQFSSHRHNSKLQEEWMICRVFNKRGSEKKSPFLHSHSYFLRLSSFSSTSCLPPLFQFPKTLLDTQYQTLQPFQDSNLINQESNQDHLKTLINSSKTSQPPILPISSIIQPSCSSFTVNTTYPLQSTSVLKTILSHQECTVHGSSPSSTTAPKQWQQTETNYHSHFRPCTLQWEDKDPQVPPGSGADHHQSPFSFEMGCRVLGLSAAAAATDHTVLHEMSTSSVDFNCRADSSMQHPPI